MQELVLAGQNPKEPAIDAETGAPVTIEELLRRRGLMAYSGNMRFTPLDTSSTASATGNMSDASVQGAAGNSGAASMIDVGAAVASEQDIPPEAAQQFADLEAATGGDASSIIDELIALGLMGGTAAVLYRMWRNRRAGGNSSDPDGGMRTPAMAPAGAGGSGSGMSPNLSRIDGVVGGAAAKPVVDGEFSEVRGISGPANDNVPSTVAGALTDQRRGQTQMSDAEISPSDREGIAVATRHRDAATSPQIREYWQQVIDSIERRVFGAPTSQRVDPNMGRGQGPAMSTAPAAQNSVAGALENRQGTGRRQRAEMMQQRGATTQPNDIGTMPMGEDLSMYSEEDVRQANSIADELIAERMRGQRLRGGRERIAGAPSAPVYPPRANEPVNNQRPALVNEILRQITQRTARGGR